LGNGTNDNSTTPVQVNSLSKVIAIAAGSSHSLALKSNGAVWAWPANYADLDNRSHYDPVRVNGLTSGLIKVTAISAGGSHNLAVKNNGTVWAWGVNILGQLGDGTNYNYSETAVRVIGLPIDNDNSWIWWALGGIVATILFVLLLWFSIILLKRKNKQSA